MAAGGSVNRLTLRIYAFFNLFPFTKIDQRLDHSKTLDDSRSKFFIRGPHSALLIEWKARSKQLSMLTQKMTHPRGTNRHLPLRLCLCINEVFQTFDLSQI
jgi:hypothetical protein